MSDSLEYSCHGFHDELPKGRASGTFHVYDSGIEFNIKNHNGRIPFDGAELKLGGASDRLIFLSHPNFPQWTFYTSDRSILNNPSLQQHPELLRQVNSAKTKNRFNAALIWMVVTLLIALPLGMLFQMDWLTHQVAKKVPAQWETQLGESTLAQYRLGKHVMPEESTDELLQPLISPLLNALNDTRYPFDFYIVNQEVPNAFALPGGFIVIHSGLILKADSAEELLGVVGHEITHITQQHGIRNVIGSAGIYLLIGALVGDTTGLAALIAGSAPFLLNQSYSRKFEREADRLGYDLLIKAQINPKGLASFFEKLLEEERKMMSEMGIEDEDDQNRLKDAFGFLSTHPASEERVAYLESLPLDPNMEFLNLTNEFESLKLAVQRFVAEQDPTESPSNAPNESPNNESTN